MIAGFTHRYPGVTINLLEGTSSELCQAVRERRADLCIASRREGPFRWTPIHEGPLVVLVPERHPLAEGDRVPIDALRTEPFIELNPGLETDNSRFFAKYDLHPNTRFTTSDPTAVRSIVSAGLGISLINDLQAGTEKNGIRILPTDPEQLALTLNGKKRNIRKKDLLALAESCGISSAAALKLIRSITARQDSYLALCRESWLPEEMKTGLADLICRRMAEMQ